MAASPSAPDSPTGFALPESLLRALVVAPFSDHQRRVVMLLWCLGAHKAKVAISTPALAAEMRVAVTGGFREALRTLAKARVIHAHRVAGHVSTWRLQPEPSKWGAFAPKAEAAPELAPDEASPADVHVATVTQDTERFPKPRKETYIDRFVALHRELFGSLLPHQKCGRPLKELVTQHGEGDVTARYRVYADEALGKPWCSFWNFVENYHRYDAGPDTTDYRKIL